MTVRHIKYGARAEDVGTFAAAFIETVERLLGDKWYTTRSCTLGLFAFGVEQYNCRSTVAGSPCCVQGPPVMLQLCILQGLGRFKSSGAV